mgnify:CR=1 FL=1|tara:strand:- start:1311 stop:1925 length:615 start_codon:yes stop_codon:yes gene_type:complete
MSVIFPGNYVADLNAYRTQGVYAIPGVEFYQKRGVAFVTADIGSSGSLPLKILSPDLRPDDKPRLDKDFKILSGSTVYQTAITAVNLKTAGSATVSVDGLNNGDPAIEATLTAASGVLPTAGVTTSFDFASTNKSAEAYAEDSDGNVTEISITVAHSGALEIINSAERAYVIVEVCYFKTASAAPVADDDRINLPFLTEEGSGT